MYILMNHGRLYGRLDGIPRFPEAIVVPNKLWVLWELYLLNLDFSDVNISKDLTYAVAGSSPRGNMEAIQRLHWAHRSGEGRLGETWKAWH